MFDIQAFNRARIAHGVLMSLAVIVFFPLGAVLLRLLRTSGNVKIHMVWQCLGLAILIAGFGLGLRVQKQIFIEWSDPHQKIGAVLFVLFLCMPIIGAINHWRVRKGGKKTILGYGHVWIGRILIIIGLIDGGFGLKLAKEGSGGKIAYAVLAAVAALSYGGLLIWWYFFGGKKGKVVDNDATGGIELAEGNDQNK